MNKKLINRLFSMTVVMLSIGVLFSCTRTKEAASKATTSWTDSAGRVVETASKIERIAPSGPLAQIILYSLCPDKVIGWASPFSDMQKKYIAQKYWDKPSFGQFYGRSSNLNMEALIAAKPDVILDIGEVKPNIKADMDGIQQQTGIPVLFIEATLDTMSEAYLKLGAIVGEETQAAALAGYVTATLQEAAEKRRRITEPKRVYFGEGKTGQNANGRGSIHADVIEYAGGINAADLQKVAPTGGDPVSMEQIILWQPDVVILGAGGFYAELAADAAWKPVPAVQTGAYYEVPQEPYSWMGRPPSINRLIGIKWLGNLLYPEVFDYDIKKEAREFYQLFYHYAMQDEDLARLLAHSTLK